jgi:hypothetical protein
MKPKMNPGALATLAQALRFSRQVSMQELQAAPDKSDVAA